MVPRAGGRDEKGRVVKIMILALARKLLIALWRFVKRLARAMLGVKFLRSAVVILAGIKLMPMICKGQLQTTGELCRAEQFNSLTG